MKVLLLAGAVFVFLTAAASADKIYLSSGKLIEGTLVAKTEDAATVDIDGVMITYRSEEIDRIGVPETSPFANGRTEEEVIEKQKSLAKKIFVEKKVPAPEQAELNETAALPVEGGE